MSRRTNGRPALPRPCVLLHRDATGCRKPPKTLIGQASRALYIARRPDDASAMRDLLLAADPPDYLPILRAFVDLWPAALAAEWPTGDPARHWATDRIPPAQRRKDAA